MKRVSFIICAIIILCSFTPVPKIVGKWKLISVREIRTGAVDSTLKFQEGLNIQFNKDNTCSGKLTVNTFGASYTIDKNKIAIKDIILTKICCDSETANEFLDDLQTSERFFVKEDTLILTGPMKVVRLLRIK